MGSRALRPHQLQLMNPPVPCCPQAAPPHPPPPSCCPHAKPHPGPVWVAEGGQVGQGLKLAPLHTLGA